MGLSGQIMSQRIFGIDTPFGQIMQTSEECIGRYAVMETFNFPLKTEDWCNDVPQDMQAWCRLKEIEKQWNGNRGDQYSNIRSHISTIKKSKVFLSYVNNLDEALLLFENLKQIVFCGFIAQSMFLEKINHTPFLYKVRNDWKGYDLRFVNHPSSATNASEWVYEPLENC